MKLHHFNYFIIVALITLLGCSSSSDDSKNEVVEVSNFVKIPRIIKIPKNHSAETTSLRVKRGGFSLPFHAGFESNTLKMFDFSWLKVKSAVSIVKTHVRSGKRALLVTLIRNQDTYSKGKRSELAIPYTFAIGKSYWYGISIYIPKDWKEDYKGEVLTQWFATRDKELGEKGRSPALAIRINKKKWFITNRFDSNPLTLKNSGKKETLYRVPYKRGVWTDWAFFVRWSWKKDGIIRVYKNRKLVATKKGCVTYNDKKGPIMKFGIYKAPWNNPKAKSNTSKRTIYIDEIHITDKTGSISLVSPQFN